jgi:hypothetical protein
MSGICWQLPCLYVIVFDEIKDLLAEILSELRKLTQPSNFKRKPPSNRAQMADGGSKHQVRRS